MILQFHSFHQDEKHTGTFESKWVLFDDSPDDYNKLAEGKEISDGDCAGENLEVIAGYRALTQGMDFLLKGGIHTKSLLVESDSNMVINHMSGATQILDPSVVKWYVVAKKFENTLKYNGACRKIHFQHVLFNGIKLETSNKFMPDIA